MFAQGQRFRDRSLSVEPRSRLPRRGLHEWPDANPFRQRRGVGGERPVRGRHEYHEGLGQTQQDLLLTGDGRLGGRLRHCQETAGR